MLQKVLQSILRRYFGQFITGLQNVELAFWTGKIHIQNASFRHQKINEMLKIKNIPLAVKFSFLGSLELDIPWNKLSSAPVEIKLSNVYIVFSLQKVADSMQKEQNIEENAKLLLIKNYVSFIQKKSEQLKNEGQNQSGFLKKLMIKILHNVNIQITNIHIRVQSTVPKEIEKPVQHEEDLFYSCLGENDKPIGFSLGFCIESIQAQTINERNEKQFVQIENQKTSIRKTIVLKQISFYWEEEQLTNLLSYSNERKIQILRDTIKRQQHRLLTIDGTLLMEKNKDDFQYFFSTEFNLLEVKTNYKQLRQIIQVNQQFANATTKKKLVKMKQLSHQMQLALEKEYKQVFRNLYEVKFQKITAQVIKLIESVDKKLLIKWTRDECIELLKEEKFKNVRQNKGKKSWFSFLSKKSQQQLQLTEEQVKIVQADISKFLAIVYQKDKQISIGFSIIVFSLQLVVEHSEYNQKLLFASRQIQLKVRKIKDDLKVDLSVLDVDLTYYDLKKLNEVGIFKKIAEKRSKLMTFSFLDTPQQQKLILQMQHVCFKHQIQFLGFISEMINLQQREEGKAQMALFSQDSYKKQSEKQIEQKKKSYDYRVRLKKLEIKLQLDDKTQLYSYIEQISIEKDKGDTNVHSAMLKNFALVYLHASQNQKTYKIIDDINITVKLTGLKELRSKIPKISVVLNEQSLYAIGNCLKEQYKLLKVRKMQYKKELIEEEEKYMQGETQIMSILKSLKVYHTMLISDSLLFYEKTQGKADLSQISKKISLQNLTISRRDDLSFKLESMLTNEIISCRTKEDTDMWIYLIEQRIYECSNKFKLFNMVEEESEKQNAEALIYIPYDSTIDILVQHFEIVYLKNNTSPMMSIALQKLNLLFKENNLHFERQIFIDELSIKNLSLINETRDEFNTILSNVVNYFEDALSDEQEEMKHNSNISILLQGKKKTHPQYTGELSIKANINKLFVNYDAEFIYGILYRLVFGDIKSKAYTEIARNQKVIQILKQLLQQNNGIPQKFSKAQPFQFNRSYLELEKYRQIHSSNVLFHVELKVEEVEVYFVCGSNHIWEDKIQVDGLSIQIDKSTQFIFMKGRARDLSVSDLTSYPHTHKIPFMHGEAYPLVSALPNRKNKYIAQFYAGLFEPMVFTNRQSFKNYFEMNLYDALINYQQQPLMRLIDFLTHQAILFILQPFSLHKFDSPERGPFSFGHLNFTDSEIKKILKESLYPFYTNLRIHAYNLAINFNSFPHQEAIRFNMPVVNLISCPEINNQRVHVKLDVIKKFQQEYPTFLFLRRNQDRFDSLVTKFQWATKYLITAERCTCQIFENEFSYEMYFQKANNADKDIVLPFLKIDKDMIMEGAIKSLNITANKKVYNLINKCFNFNLSYDDGYESHFITNYHYQHLNEPSKLIYHLLIGQLSYLIPQLERTVVVIPSCEYKFQKNEQNVKSMYVLGRSLYIFDAAKKDSNIITPVNFDEPKGLTYCIDMMPSGEKKMYCSLKQIELTYNLDKLMALAKYFIVDDSCYPKQQVYQDIPLIRCEADILNSYIKIAEIQDFVYALKGENIKVIWTRNKGPHPEQYRKNKDLYPNNTEASSYDIKLEGEIFCKYSISEYEKKSNTYRPLSTFIRSKIKFTNVMKRNLDFFYTDMVGDYEVDNLQLKLCYKDILELQQSFKDPNNQQILQSAESKREKRQSIAASNQILGYIPHNIHQVTINKFKFELGLSELPVPLISLSLQNSQAKVEMLGPTKIITNKLEMIVDYWNMLIGRWQPLLEKSIFDITLRIALQDYYSISSLKPVLLNFSTESLKVLKLISEDFSEKGNTRILSHEGKKRDKRVSPYAITNRTGYSLIFINLDASEGVNANKLRNNETIHIRNKNNQITNKQETVKFIIQGDTSERKINLNIVEAEQKKITYNQSDYYLTYHVISSPILKQIVISSPYVIHNKTAFKMILSVGSHEFSAEPDKKVAIPFTTDMHSSKEFKINFPHLTEIQQNYAFTYFDLRGGYEHKIIYGKEECFYCLIEVESVQESVISVSPLTTIFNLTPLTVKAEVSIAQYKGSKKMISEIFEVNKQKVFYQFGSRDHVTVRMKLRGFNISSFQNMGLGKITQEVDSQCRFMLPDHHGLETFIKYRLCKKGRKKFIHLYSECLLINESSYNIYLFEGTQLLPGQRLKAIPESESKYIFINDTSQLSVGFKQDDPTQTQKISLKELGNQYINVVSSDKLYQIVVNSSVHCIEQEMQLFTRILKVTPRYILMNECSRSICLRQVNTDQRVFLKVKERIDWYWHSKDQMRLISLAASDNQFQLADGWDFSSPIELQNLQETVLVLRPRVSSPFKLLIKVQIVKETQFTFVIFKELKSTQDSLITFKNIMKMITLEISQQFLDGINTPWANFKHFQCLPGKETMFGWDFPRENKIVNVQFNFLGALRTKYNDDFVAIDTTRLSKPIIVEFKGDQGGKLEIEVSLQLVGIRKKIMFELKDQSQASRVNDQQVSEISGSKMGVDFPQIGISLIGGRKPRCQIIFISIKKLELIMMEKQHKRNYELKIRYINIDNNLNHNTIYPVLFTPLKEKKTVEKARPFFICLVEQNLKSKKITEINYFRMAIEPISFKLYDEIITKIYDMQKELNSVNEKERKVDLCETFRSYEREAEWKMKQPSRGDKSIFIRDVEIGKIIIELSFSIKPTSGGNIVLYTIVTLFKTVLSNVSESQIKLSRFSYKNVNLSELTNQLSEFYRKEVFKQIYKIPGSINILGNPYVFVKYMAEGVWEIINQPSEGFIKGPIEGALGVVKGGVFFTRNVVAGTCNSFEVMGESISQGISYVTFDHKFVTRREKIQMQKSKHLGDGARSAAFAIYTGVELAFKGLYRLPKENMEKSGVPGFFKGVMFAVTGMFTKPLSGLFQGLSKFSQGVKQTALYFQDGPNNSRSRPPRVFVGGQQYYTQYNTEESKAINLLEFHSTKYLNTRILFVSADATAEGDDTTYTVLTDYYLVVLSKQKKKIVKEIRLDQINEVDPSRIEVSRQLTVKFNDTQSLIIVSHKCKEMFHCFEILFEKAKDNSEVEEIDSD